MMPVKASFVPVFAEFVFRHMRPQSGLVVYIVANMNINGTGIEIINGDKIDLL